jgi:hypothetical protein
MADPLVSLPAAQTALTRGGQAPTPSTAKWGLFVSFLKKGSVHKKKKLLELEQLRRLRCWMYKQFNIWSMADPDTRP